MYCANVVYIPHFDNKKFYYPKIFGTKSSNATRISMKIIVRDQARSKECETNILMITNDSREFVRPFDHRDLCFLEGCGRVDGVDHAAQDDLAGVW